MGSPDSDTESSESEKPQHDVTLTKPFLMARTEVTQQLWQAVMSSNPSYFTGDDKRPVEQVSWNDAQSFVAALNTVEGVIEKYRLPTEAEWEYAARAGSTSPGYGSPDNIAWYSVGQTHAVKGKAANAWGLYDMLGNVWEWTADNWRDDWDRSSPYWAATAVTDPKGPASGSYRVVRGGSWSDSPSIARAACRTGSAPGRAAYVMGFRPARSLP
jgi:formylglycine-generating enzyme required for sulfatase activity